MAVQSRSPRVHRSVIFLSVCLSSACCGRRVRVVVDEASWNHSLARSQSNSERGSTVFPHQRLFFQPLRLARVPVIEAALANREQRAMNGHPARVKQTRERGAEMSQRASSPEQEDDAAALKKNKSLRKQFRKNRRRAVFWEAKASQLLKRMPDWFLFSALGVITREIASRDLQRELDKSEILLTISGKDAAKSLSKQMRQNLDDKVQRALRVARAQRGQWSSIGRSILQAEFEDLKERVSNVTIDSIVSDELVVATLDVVEAETWGRTKLLLSEAFVLNEESAAADLDEVMRMADTDGNNMITLDELYEYVVGVSIAPLFEPFARRFTVLQSEATANNSRELYFSSFAAQEVKKLRQLLIVARTRYERSWTTFQLNVKGLKRWLFPDEFVSALPDDFQGGMQDWRDTPSKTRPTLGSAQEKLTEPDEKPSERGVRRWLRKLLGRRRASKDQTMMETANMWNNFPDVEELESLEETAKRLKTQPSKLETFLEEVKARQELAELEIEANKWDGFPDAEELEDLERGLKK